VSKAVWLASSLFATPQNPLDGFRKKRKKVQNRKRFLFFSKLKVLLLSISQQTIQGRYGQSLIVEFMKKQVFILVFFGRVYFKFDFI
jgi:hypothetical protein